MQCRVCERADVPLQQCAKCQAAIYCSKQCQAVDWFERGHKVLCGASLTNVRPTEITRLPTGGQMDVTVTDSVETVSTLAPMQYDLGRSRRGFLYELYGDDQLQFTVAFEEKIVVNVALRAQTGTMPRRSPDEFQGTAKLISDKKRLERERLNIVETPCTKGEVYSQIRLLERNVRAKELQRRGYSVLSVDVGGDIANDKIARAPDTSTHEFPLANTSTFLQMRVSRSGSTLIVDRIRFFVDNKVARV